MITPPGSACSTFTGKMPTFTKGGPTRFDFDRQTITVFRAGLVAIKYKTLLEKNQPLVATA